MRKILVTFIAICFSGLWGLVTAQDNMNMKMTQGKFNSFRRAKRIYYKGHVDFTKKKFSRSFKSFRKCVEVFPEFSEAWFYMSKIDYMEKRFDSALANIELAKKNHNFMFQLQMSGKTEYLRNIDGVKQAEAGNSIKSDKKDLRDGNAIPTDYFFHEGNIFMKLGKPGKAYEAYVNAIESNPENKYAYTNLLALLLRSNNGDKALEYLKKAELNNVILNPSLKAAVLKMKK